MKTFIAQPETIKQCMKNTNDAELYNIMEYVLKHREPFQPLLDSYSKRPYPVKRHERRLIINGAKG